jgi:hypothetical protein
MLEFFDSSAKLVGHSGSILLADDDEITRKLAMLFEGQCEGLGPTLAARKFGYTKQRYFQLLEQFEAQGALALQSKARGPKTNYRRTEVMVRQIIRHRPATLFYLGLSGKNRDSGYSGTAGTESRDPQPCSGSSPLGLG